MSAVFKKTISWLTPSKSKKAHKKRSATPRSNYSSAQQSVPMSLPRWETLPSPESTVATSSPPRSKRSFDELEGSEQTTTPVKKRATEALAVASSSRVRLDSAVDPTLLYRTPPSTQSNGGLKTYTSAKRTTQRTIPNSPSLYQAEKIESAKRRRVVIPDLIQGAEPRKPEAGATPFNPRPSAKALGKQKEVPAEQTVEYNVKESTRAAPSPSTKAFGKRREAPREQSVNCTSCPSGAQSATTPTKKRKHDHVQADDTELKEMRSSKKVRMEAPYAGTSSSRSKAVHPVDNAPKQTASKRVETANRTMDTGRGKARNVQITRSRSPSLATIQDDSSRSSTPDSESDTDSGTSDDSFWDDNEENEEWINNIARKFGLSQDNTNVLRKMRREPEDRRFMFLIALHMSRDPWKIPPESKKKLNDVALDLLLSFNWPTVFKDREVNVYRLLEHIRAKPAKLGLDKSWITDDVKFYALRTQALTHFSEARRKIIEAIKESIRNKETVKELAASLGKEGPTKDQIELLSLLRQEYLKTGRTGFFDAVDDKIRKLHNSSFKEVKRELDRYRKKDKRAFPRSQQ